MHHHMIGVQPAVIFLHYFGTGPADQAGARRACRRRSAGHAGVGEAIGAYRHGAWV